MGAGGAERKAGGRQSALLAQYARIKAQHQRSILLFRLGDFYEMFFDDAEVAARTLDLTLTARNRGDPDEVPLCGFPVHAAQPYVARLLAAGPALAYVDAVYRRRPAHLRPPEAYALAGFLGLDAATRRNLELLQTLAGERRGSLLWVLDETQTAMGARRLREWLLYPLCD